MNKKNELTKTDNIIGILIPNPQKNTYVELKKNQKTDATTQTVKQSTGEVVKYTETKEGTKIGTVIRTPNFSNKAERNASIRDLDKNGVKQIDNAIAHNVSQATVSKEVNK